MVRIGTVDDLRAPISPVLPSFRRLANVEEYDLVFSGFQQGLVERGSDGRTQTTNGERAVCHGCIDVLFRISIRWEMPVWIDVAVDDNNNVTAINHRL